MKPVRSLLATLTVLFAGCATAPAPVPTVSEPTNHPPQNATGKHALVVMVVVDQLRPSYLEQYGDLFTGGFRRLLDQGRVYTSASHDHAVTETAAGHATLTTGVYPMRHGIVANEWAERTPAGWREMSNVGDSTVQIVGRPGASGVSPRNLMRTGIADWLMAANARSKVASVSGKDRGAVLPAGRTKGDVYWFDPAAGRFVTSTYYESRFPRWADDFTSRVLPRYARDSVWTNLTPVSALARTTQDTAAYEGDGTHTYFPHRFADEGTAGRFWDWFLTTPMLDAATLDFAQAMVTSLGLGRDDAPDLLNVSLSQMDRVGHAYGALSREQLDNLLRLDRELGAFFTFLDRTVGTGKWIVALSADHGALLAPETLPQPDEPIKGSRATDAERAALRAIRTDAALTAYSAGASTTTALRVVAALKRLPFVADAWTAEQLVGATPADSFAVFARRSLYPGRAASDMSPFGVEVRYIEGRYAGARGSGHGSPYWYDRHVPIIFMGVGIPAGKDASRVSTTDFAPTLARLLGIVSPGDLDGRALMGVVGR